MTAAAERRATLAWVVSLGLHALIAVYAALLPPHAPPPPRRAVDVELLPPPPETRPAPPPPERPAPKPAPPAQAAAPEQVIDVRSQTADAAPPPSEADAEAPAEAKPVFGLGKASFGSQGSFAMRRGNTVAMAAADSPFTAEEVAALGIVPIYEVSTLPRILAQPQPMYPPALRSAGIEGEVVLDVVVAADGSVADVRVVEATHPEFVAAALETVRATTFAPAQRGRTAVAVRIRLPVKFRLR